jgi:hypothetical protein
LWAPGVPGSAAILFLLSKTEKAARGGLFLFLLYKFRISHQENKPAKYLCVYKGVSGVEC